MNNGLNSTSMIIWNGGTFYSGDNQQSIGLWTVWYLHLHMYTRPFIVYIVCKMICQECVHAAYMHGMYTRPIYNTWDTLILFASLVPEVLICVTQIIEIYVHTRLLTYIPTYKHIDTYIHTLFERMGRNIHACMHACIHRGLHAYIDRYIHTYILNSTLSS